MIFGILFDKIGHRRTMFCIVFVYALASAALLGALFTGSTVLLVASFVLTGAGYGGAVAMNPVFAARFFGRKNYGANYSIINISPIFAVIIGPTVGSGDYLRAFIFVGIFTAIAFAAMLLMKKPESNTSD
jgi:OFA family oxalate/formate antiporter-like MFS transporter